MILFSLLSRHSSAPSSSSSSALLPPLHDQLIRSSLLQLYIFLAPTTTATHTTTTYDNNDLLFFSCYDSSSVASGVLLMRPSGLRPLRKKRSGGVHSFLLGIRHRHNNRILLTIKKTETPGLRPASAAPQQFLNMTKAVTRTQPQRRPSIYQTKVECIKDHAAALRNNNNTLCVDAR